MTPKTEKRLVEEKKLMMTKEASLTEKNLKGWKNVTQDLLNLDFVGGLNDRSSVE